MGKSESQMDIMEKSSKPGKRRWTVAEISLSVLLLVVSCALTGLVVLYTSAVKEQSSGSSVSGNSTGEGRLFHSHLDKVCTSADCVTAAARLLKNMDKSVQPCDNFYQYACGGWMESHVIPEASSSHSIFDILTEEKEIVLKGELETTNKQDREAIKKVKVLYSSCMNESLIEQRGSQPLLKLIDSIGGWPVASEKWTTKKKMWSLEDMLATLTVYFQRKVVLDMFVWTDDQDSQRYIIYIDQPVLGMPSRDYYFNGGHFQKSREAYLQYMISIAKITREDRNLPQDDDQVRKEMMQVLNLETDIAKAMSPGEERQDVTVLYNKMTLGELQSNFSFNGFNWMRFIKGVLSSVSIDVQMEEEVVVYSSPYLKKMNKVLSRYSVRTMQNYLIWQVIFDNVKNLSRRFKEARARYRKILEGTTEEIPEWCKCVRYAQSSMKNAVGALYVRENFAGQSKQMVRDLIHRIQRAYVDTLEELTWMDVPSKEKAREKAMTIKEHIGYPDHILQKNNQKLDQEYADLNFSEEHYFENILKNLRSEAHKSLKRLRERVDPNLWVVGPAEVNAFYSHSRNQIVFPAGILQPPFFSKHQHQALNFGGIGMIIGHELTHGFDDNGRYFDKDGNMLNWWSDYSAKHFKEQSQCMVQQYDNFKWELAFGQNVNGITTLGENIADNGGIRQAYKAYLKWVEKEGEELRLPGLNMDHKQLFFLNFAQVWCSAYRPEYASLTLKIDSHSPSEHRVLGPLQNFKAFSEAFQCPTGSPMNPKQKCRVW